MISRRLWWITECLFCLWWFKAEKNDVNFWNSCNVNVHSSLFYIQSFWLNMLHSNPGCVSVCLCVCLYVCVISTAQTDEPILMKLSTNHLTDICQWHFSRFLKFRIWWRHGGHFAFLRCGTLTVAILVRFSSNLDTSYFVVCRCWLLKISKIGW